MDSQRCNPPDCWQDDDCFASFYQQHLDVALVLAPRRSGGVCSEASQGVRGCTTMRVNQRAAQHYAEKAGKACVDRKIHHSLPTKCPGRI